MRIEILCSIHLYQGASIFDVSANITLVLGYDLPGPDAYSRTEV